MGDWQSGVLFGAGSTVVHMIRLEQVSKRFRTPTGDKVVADAITMTFPRGLSIGLMGRNGAGKSTLMEIIAGQTQPDSGHVIREGTISWPVGFAGSFHKDLTGAQNIRFVARVYGVETDSLMAFVQGFADLGPHLDAPVRTYSSGMRARLAFAVSVGIPFDTYLIDEVTSVGDAAFRGHSQAVLQYRLQSAGAIVVTHSLKQLRALCDAAIILENGRLTFFDDLEEAIEQHKSNLVD